MLRACLLSFALLLAAPAALGHSFDDPLIDPDQIVVPRNIPFELFVGFTPLDYRIMHDRIVGRGDAHHIGTMSLDLTREAVLAGRKDPIATSVLVQDMADLSDNASRTARLEEEATRLDEAAAALQATIEGITIGTVDGGNAELRDAAAALSKIRAVQAFVAAWTQNPMDGAGS